MELVKNINRSYRIQSHKEHSYRVRIPKKITDKIGYVPNKLGVKISRNDIYSTVDFYTDIEDWMVTRDVVKSNRTIRIPSPIGDLMNMRRDKINWVLYKNESGGYIFRIVSSYMPLKINTDKWKKLTSIELKPTKNNDKEHFDLQFSTKNNVEWTNSTQINFILSEFNSELSIRCQPVTDENADTTDVTRITKSSERFRFYIPRSLIRSLDLSNKNASLYYRNDSLSIVSSD